MPLVGPGDLSSVPRRSQARPYTPPVRSSPELSELEPRSRSLVPPCELIHSCRVLGASSRPFPSKGRQQACAGQLNMISPSNNHDALRTSGSA